MLSGNLNASVIRIRYTRTFCIKLVYSVVTGNNSQITFHFQAIRLGARRPEDKAGSSESNEEAEDARL